MTGSDLHASAPGGAGPERWPAVTVAVPVLNECENIGQCLAAVDAQTYLGPVEVLVVDGGSSDDTIGIAGRYPKVRILRNTDRIQASGLNMALREAQGDIFVRVDARTRIAADYLTACVEALWHTGAALVGGAQVPVGTSAVGRAAAHAMTSPVGVGAAAFRRAPRAGRWVETVYLGAGWTSMLREIGGYAALPVNEDAELAARCTRRGGVWLDPTIESIYVVREDLRATLHQFLQYGRGRATTVLAGVTSPRPRHLAATLMPLVLVTRWRRVAFVGYTSIVLAVAARIVRSDPGAAAALIVTLPLMQLAWSVGFWSGAVGGGVRVAGDRMRFPSRVRSAPAASGRPAAEGQN